LLGVYEKYISKFPEPSPPVLLNGPTQAELKLEVVLSAVVVS